MWVSTLLRRFFYRRQRNSRFIEKQMRNMTVKFQDTWKVCDMAQNYYLDEALLDIQEFASLRNYHFQLVDGLDVLLHDPNVRGHTEFPLQIESLKRSGAFIVMHASENYDKFGRRLEDVNEDMLVLTSYIVRHLCISQH